MPITSDFSADFSKFVAAVETAQTKLITFEGDAKKVEATLTSMERSISGVPIVQAATVAANAVERLGGVSKLTYDELQRLGGTAQAAVDKMNALGQAVPTSIQALADQARGAAEEMLRLQGAAEKTGDGFKGWAGKIDIKSAITDPLGTAKDGVMAMAETLGPAGVLAAKTIAGVATVGAALIHLGNDAEEVGRSIGKMGMMFNVPVEAMSDLRFAITAAGGDFGSLGDSMFMFQKRIEDNGDQVKKGVEKIGLSFDSLKNMRPDEQLLAISDAMRAAGGEVNKSAIAFEIFGRQGKEMLPLLMKPLSDLTDESKKLGATWSQDDVQAAKDFGREATKLAAETEEAWTSLGRTVAPVTNELVLAWDQLKLRFAQGVAMPFEGWAEAFGVLKGALGENALADERVNAVLDASTRLYAQAAKEGLNYAEQTKEVASKMLELGYTQENVARVTGLTIDKVRELAGELRSAKTAADAYNDAWKHLTDLEEKGVPTIQNLSQETKDYVVHLQALHAKELDIQTATGVTIDQQKLIADAHKAATTEADKYAAAWTNLNSLGSSYADTVAQINPKLAAQATYYLEAGASVGDLAAAFPALTTAQVKALDEMVKASQKFRTEFDKNQVEIEEDTKKATTKINEQIIAANAVIMKASAEAKDFQMKNSMDETSYKVMKIWETADAQVAAFKGTAEQSAQYAAVVYGHAADMQAKIEEDAYGHMQDLSEKILVDVVAVANKLKGIADDTTNHMKQAAQQLQTLQGGAKMPGTSIDASGYMTLPNGTRIEIGPHGELPDNIDDLMMGRTTFSSGISNQPRIGSGFQARAEGGSVSSGTPYLVGERGPELFVPAASGSIVPNGAGSSVTQNVVIHVNGTAADVARQVAAELMRTLRAGQQLPLR